MIGGNTILKSIFSITLVGILLGGHTYKPSIEQFLIGFSDAIYLGSAQSIAGFILIFTICNVLLIPTLMLNLLAGYFWGTFGGGAIVTIAITIGGTICFTLSRGTGGSALAQKIQKKISPKLIEMVKRHNAILLCFLRLNPLVPTSPLNYCLGMSRLSYQRFLITLSAPISIPSTIIAHIGANISNIPNVFSEDFAQRDQLTSTLLHVGIASIILLLLCLIALYQRTK